MPNTEKHTPEYASEADAAYRTFAANPLVAIAGGIDRASFIAGYDSANELRAAQNKRLREIIAGMLAIEDSVTQGQESELCEIWIPQARATIAKGDA